jgi:hypothetical protein
MFSIWMSQPPLFSRIALPRSGSGSASKPLSITVTRVPPAMCSRRNSTSVVGTSTVIRPSVVCGQRKAK